MKRAIKDLQLKLPKSKKLEFLIIDGIKWEKCISIDFKSIRKGDDKDYSIYIHHGYFMLFFCSLKHYLIPNSIKVSLNNQPNTLLVIITKNMKELVILLSYMITIINGLKLCSNETKSGDLCLKESAKTAPVPVQIETMIWIDSIHKVDENSKTLSIFFELVTKWKDERIELYNSEE